MVGPCRGFFSTKTCSSAVNTTYIVLSLSEIIDLHAHVDMNSANLYLFIAKDLKLSLSAVHCDF